MREIPEGLGGAKLEQEEVGRVSTANHFSYFDSKKLHIVAVNFKLPLQFVLLLSI